MSDGVKHNGTCGNVDAQGNCDGCGADNLDPDTGKYGK